ALPPLVAELPWGHNVVLLEKVSTTAERLWYAEMAARHGWSRNVLLHQIETGLQTRSGTAVTNFDRTLPAPHSDLARELLKDPYHFEFLQLGAEVLERDVERALLANVRDFLMELGVGFALVGSQYHLEVGGQDYYLDLLFFHVRLRRYVVVELKVGAFQPEDAGKMNFYLAAVDDLVREEGHEPSIGLILCKEHNRVVAEYALRFAGKPIGIAEFRLLGELPATLRGNLPSVEELEKRLDRDDGFER
ncbi:MAG TPA: PDDEXK nuclease domain-containing protein, partial [Longimicrobium sp.]